MEAIECLDRVHLLDKAYETTSELSGGQKQRVGIARSMMQKPVAILADEPVSNLDPLIAHDILSLLKKICVDEKIAVICNLHQVDFTLQFADRVVCLVNGRIIVNEKASNLTAEDIHQSYHGII